MDITQRLYERIVALTQRVSCLVNEAIGIKGQMADIAERYEAESYLCPRCGAALDETGRCPLCCPQEDET